MLRLSGATYNQSSVAAIGVAAHECGHAIQHARGYVPLKLRGALVPVANFGSAIAWPLILLGLLFNSNSSAMFLNLGVLAFSMSVLFQVVTLPVEFNASGRALRILGETGMLYPDEVNRQESAYSSGAYVCGRSSSGNLTAFAYLFADRRRRGLEDRGEKGWDHR